MKLLLIFKTFSYEFYMHKISWSFKEHISTKLKVMTVLQPPSPNFTIMFSFPFTYLDFIHKNPDKVYDHHCTIGR